MIIDIFGSLKENFTKKVRNPFFGTLTIVIILKNWTLFYSLIYFDSNFTLEQRITEIERCINEAGGSACMFWEAVAWTFAAMIASYILLNAGAFISNLSDSIVNPWVVKWATKGASIVTKEKYEILNERLKILESKLEEERKRRHSTEDELEAANREITDLKANPPKNLGESSNLAQNIEESRATKVANQIYNNPDWREYFKNAISDNSIYYHDMPELGKYLFLQKVYSDSYHDNDQYVPQMVTPFGNEVIELFLNKIANE